MQWGSAGFVVRIADGRQELDELLLLTRFERRQHPQIDLINSGLDLAEYLLALCGKEQSVFTPVCFADVPLNQASECKSINHSGNRAPIYSDSFREAYLVRAWQRLHPIKHSAVH